MRTKKGLLWCFSILAAMGGFFLPAALAMASGDTAGSGGYLSQYQSTNPHPTSVSFFSTLAYLLSLVVIFAFVAGLAYYVSHYLGDRFGKGIKKDGSGGILSYLPLGPNRSVCVIELAGHIMIIGVTDHNISLLREVTDMEEIKRLKLLSAQSATENDFAKIFGKQFNSIDNLSQRLSTIFKRDKYHK